MRTSQSRGHANKECESRVCFQILLLKLLVLTCLHVYSLDILNWIPLGMTPCPWYAPEISLSLGGQKKQSSRSFHPDSLWLHPLEHTGFHTVISQVTCSLKYLSDIAQWTELLGKGTSPKLGAVLINPNSTEILTHQ